MGGSGSFMVNLWITQVSPKSSMALYCEFMEQTTTFTVVAHRDKLTSTMEPPPTKPESSPAEKFRAFAQKVISVPKEEIQRKEAQYKQERQNQKPKAG